MLVSIDEGTAPASVVKVIGGNVVESICYLRSRSRSRSLDRIRTEWSYSARS